MNILAIETSCDDTSLALLEIRGVSPETLSIKVLKNIVSSQIKIHRPWGGVVPNLAKREHLKNLPLLIKKIPEKNLRTLDVIAVTVGPGLEPALWTGIGFAKELHKKLKKENKKLLLLGANHLEGHLYSFLLSKKTVNLKSKTSKIKLTNNKIFPAIALLVSGGHTMLIKMESLTKWKKLGETRDDAAGEAFDKVARMLGLPYPGGPEIEKLAGKGDALKIEFPSPMIHSKNYDFSFSGLKTAVLYYLREKKYKPKMRTLAADVSAGFQHSATRVLVSKTMRATEEYKAKSVFLSGGVAANKFLRKKLKTETKKKNVRFFVPSGIFNTDNAAMIGVAGYISLLRKKKRRLVANGNLDL